MIKEKKETVRLDAVEINGLFDTFNYRFNYSNPEHVSIVMAPNGCGKTTIFKFISFLFHPTKEMLQPVLSVPYESVTCILSDGSKIGIKREVIGTKKTDDEDEPEIYKIYNFTYWEVDKLGNERSFDFLKELGKILREKSNRNGFVYEEILTGYIEDDDIEGYGERGFSEGFLKQLGQMPAREWDEFIQDDKKEAVANCLQLLLRLRKFKTHLPKVCFINADRKAKFIGDSSSYRYTASRYNHKIRSDERDEIVDNVDPIKAIQRDIRFTIMRIIRKYDRLMDEAKNNLPKRYLKNEVGGFKNKEEFLKAWNRYTEDINKYAKLGLIPSGELEIAVDDIDKEYDTKGVFLGIYLAEYQKILEPMRDIYPQLELFTGILNKRNELTDKVIKIGPRFNFIAECRGKEIPISGLSSGEQNDFIMFYRLIFELEEETIILVDEPEISLHVEWQEEYIDNLLKLCGQNNCQAIVATHSPNIINTHIDKIAERVVSYVE